MLAAYWNGKYYEIDRYLLTYILTVLTKSGWTDLQGCDLKKEHFYERS